MSNWPKKGEMLFGCGFAFWPFWWRLQFRPSTELERTGPGFSWHIGPFLAPQDFNKS
jgi:hypothetical protein